MKHIDEYYEEWCGQEPAFNDCHPVHDSSETMDFAKYYHEEIMRTIKKNNMEELYQQIAEILKKKGFVFHGHEIDFVKKELNETERIFLDLNTGALFKIIESKDTKWYYRAKDVPEDEITIEDLKKLLNEIRS